MIDINDLMICRNARQELVANAQYSLSFALSYKNSTTYKKCIGHRINISVPVHFLSKPVSVRWIFNESESGFEQKHVLLLIWSARYCRSSCKELVTVCLRAKVSNSYYNLGKRFSNFQILYVVFLQLFDVDTGTDRRSENKRRML